MTFLFEQDFIAGTGKRRRDLRGRLFAKRVAIEVQTINKTEVRLCYIEVLNEHERGKGLASDAISWLCEIADARNVEMILCPVRMEDDAGLDVVQLTSWYQRYGFFRIGLSNEMRRYPRST